jgi:hypothetical protein
VPATAWWQRPRHAPSRSCRWWLRWHGAQRLLFTNDSCDCPLGCGVLAYASLHPFMMDVGVSGRAGEKSQHLITKTILGGSVFSLEASPWLHSRYPAMNITWNPRFGSLDQATSTLMCCPLPEDVVLVSNWVLRQ